MRIIRKKDNLYVKHLSSDVSFANKCSYIDYRKLLKNTIFVILTKICNLHIPAVNDEEFNIMFSMVIFLKII